MSIYTSMEAFTLEDGPVGLLLHSTHIAGAIDTANCQAKLIRQSRRQLHQFREGVPFGYAVKVPPPQLIRNQNNALDPWAFLLDTFPLAKTAVAAPDSFLNVFNEVVGASSLHCVGLAWRAWRWACLPRVRRNWALGLTADWAWDLLPLGVGTRRAFVWPLRAHELCTATRDMLQCFVLCWYRAGSKDLG